MLREKIKQLLVNFCCSECKNDFDENDIKILRKEADLCFIQIVCQKCGKDFGVVLVDLNKSLNKNEKMIPFDIEPCPDVITSDDVIEAHKLIKALDEDWQKYIPDRYQNK